MIILTLIISMIVILLLVSKRISIGYSLIAGAAVLALLNGKGFLYIASAIGKTLLEATTISLAVSILFITILGTLMDKYHILDRMILSLEKILRSAKLTILIAPAIMGTLLVTGGALMSCPVVEKLGDKLQISNDKRASINLLFRHALYFIFPLSPTIIMASQIGGYDVMDFIKLQFPIAIGMYVLGYFFYLRNVKEPAIDKIEIKDYFISIAHFVVYSSPILITLIGAVAFNMPLYISLVGGIITSIIINMYDKKKDNKYGMQESLLKTIINGIKPSMVISVIGIMIYKNVVNDMDMLYLKLNELLETGIPLELIIIISTAMISLSIGSIQPSVAILFPMILPLAPDYSTKLLYAMFIYTCAFMCYYSSPVHMCQVLTLDYFQVKMKDLYKNYAVILPSIFIIMVAIYFFKIM